MGAFTPLVTSHSAFTDSPLTKKAVSIGDIYLVRPLDVNYWVFELRFVRTGTGVSSIQVYLKAADGVILGPRIVIDNLRIVLTFGV